MSDQRPPLPPADAGPVDVNVRPRPLGTEEPGSMAIVRYLDEEGQPTCASDFQNGRVCIFYGTQKFGCSETCWFADQDGRRWTQMQRRNGGEGTLVPLPTCPLWPNDRAMRRAVGPSV